MHFKLEGLDQWQGESCAVWFWCMNLEIFYLFGFNYVDFAPPYNKSTIIDIVFDVIMGVPELAQS